MMRLGATLCLALRPAASRSWGTLICRLRQDRSPFALRRQLDGTRLRGGCADRIGKLMLCSGPKQGLTLSASVDLEKETVITNRVVDATVKHFAARPFACRTRRTSSRLRWLHRSRVTSGSFPHQDPGQCTRCPDRQWRPRPVRASASWTSRSPDGPAPNKSPGKDASTTREKSSREANRGDVRCRHPRRHCRH